MNRLGFLKHLSFLGPFLGLALVVGAFAVGDHLISDDPGHFLTERNFRTIASDTATIVVAGLGMTVIILAGGIDLSAGTMLALASVIVAYYLEADWSWPVAILAGVAGATIAGAANGLVIAKGRIVPFIVTLGTMMVWLGVAKMVADETTVRPDLYTQVPEWLRNFLSPSRSRAIYGLPLGVWLALIMAVGTAFVISRTVFGRHITAIGSNEEAARLSGLPVDRLKIIVYAIGGMFFGIAGVYFFSRMAIGDPTQGTGLELYVIAAVIIGGGSLSGGRASVAGTIAGAAIMGVIDSGCTQLGYSNPVQNIALGTIIVAAVAVDGLRQRRSG